MALEQSSRFIYLLQFTPRFVRIGTNKIPEPPPKSRIWESLQELVEDVARCKNSHASNMRLSPYAFDRTVAQNDVKVVIRDSFYSDEHLGFVLTLSDPGYLDPTYESTEDGLLVDAPRAEGLDGSYAAHLIVKKDTCKDKYLVAMEMVPKISKNLYAGILTKALRGFQFEWKDASGEVWKGRTRIDLDYQPSDSLLNAIKKGRLDSVELNVFKETKGFDQNYFDQEDHFVRLKPKRGAKGSASFLSAMSTVFKSKNYDSAIIRFRDENGRQKRDKIMNLRTMEMVIPDDYDPSDEGSDTTTSLEASISHLFFARRGYISDLQDMKQSTASIHEQLAAKMCELLDKEHERLCG